MPLFEPLPAIVWPSQIFAHLLYPANPAVSLFAVTLVVVIVKAYAIRDLRKRVVIAAAILVFVPSILLNVTLWSSFAAYVSLAHGEDPPGLEYALGRCTVSSGKLQATAVINLRNQETMVIDPHAFFIRPSGVLQTKSGTFSEDVGRVDEGLPPLVLSQSKPLFVSEPATLTAKLRRRICPRLSTASGSSSFTQATTTQPSVTFGK
jgi:hypothetical protein